MLHVSFLAILLLFPKAHLVVSDETRVTCTAAGYKCSDDCSQRGYCDGSNWMSLYNCPAGQLCIGTDCTSTGTCTTFKYSNVCFDSALKMPNLEDKTCRTYYTCQIGTSLPGTGVLQTCPTGTFFDSCSGQCNASSCSTYVTSCSGNNILISNMKLAYVCTTTPPQIIWGTCPDGIYVNLGTKSADITCTPGINNYCTNGGDSDGNGGGGGGLSCSAPGRQPIAGTDCGFLQCSSDFTYTVIPCSTGYRYDQTRKTCVVGTCTGVLPTSRDSKVNARKYQMQTESEEE